jgi:acyl transferase domain-containing protein/NADPH:quinone reductase-like Zn-dependent oxidoreductase/SAM-dependent methyltransferase/NADP-dependent 3-hydroxy acid dehydrogenase YdfG/acyl carrier protein
MDAIERERASAPEPIAIIGMGCRFPGGADSPDGFWDLLRNGVDAVTDVPPDRWHMPAFFDPDPKRLGKTYSRWGGFLKHIDRFDTQFFKIAPREAVFMDPQQRLLLEVSWEALEDGGQDADRLCGTEVGVFIGVSTHDYSDIQTKDVYWSDAYTCTGCALSIAANRLSYCFDFRGPSIAVDTACSSSLVAVHLACQSLWANESSLALAGGANCMLTPEPTVGFSKATMLSPTGRCRTFDAAADGYVRGEGAGIVVLKPLSAALADRDRIYAVIIGTGVNQDGHSQGLTVPKPEAQEALLREVYRRAHVEPEQVLYFETHGTGTPVGDPIEAAAIGAALGKRRPRGDFLRVGSLKTNIGHLEAASGIAGLIKGALLIKHQEIPATLHFRTPHPKIPLEDLQLRVQAQLESFPHNHTSSVVGVNSFGFGGTNAHVALDRAPSVDAKAETEGREASSPSHCLVPLSARSLEALHALVRAFRDSVNPCGARPLDLRDISYSAGVRRTHHDHRLAVVTNSVTDLLEHLNAFDRNEPRPGMITGRRSSGRRPKLAFVFSGMGPQWWGMGRQLLAEAPVFRNEIEACDTLFQREAGWSLLEQMSGTSGDSRMDQAEVAQPANFALQMALTALWRSWGIEADAIVGHSAGEVAGACAAGILSLEDGVRVIYHRSRLQQRAIDKGRMLAIGLAASQASAAMGRFRGRVAVAAINSPRSVTLSGDQDALEQIAEVLRDTQVFTRMLDTRVPYHSHYMDPLEGELVASLAEIAPQPAAIPFYSAVTSERVDGRELDAAYWWANIRQPVLFGSALEHMLAEGFDAFVELGPHPVLGRSIIEVHNERQRDCSAVLASLRREADEYPTMLTALATLYSIGCRLVWNGVNGRGSYVPLPTYPWQRERYWTEPEKSASQRLATSLHPLLQHRLDSVDPCWETHLDGDRLEYLSDHIIQGSVVFPTSAYIEAALAASLELNRTRPYVLEDIRFKRALIVRDDDQPRIQFVIHVQDGAFAVHSTLRTGQAWTLHATGSLVEGAAGPASNGLSRLRSIQARCHRRFSSVRCYDVLKAVGLDYGPCFRGIDQIWQGDREALGRIWSPDQVARDNHGGHIFHPAVLDACFQVISGAAFIQRGPNGVGDTYLPVEIRRFRFSGQVLGRELWCHVKLTKQTQNSLEGHFTIFDDAGSLVAEIEGFKCQRVPNPRSTASDELNGWLHELHWHAKALPLPGRVRQADHVPSPSTLARKVAPRDGGERYGRKQNYEEVEPQFDRLSAAYAWEAFRQLGWRPRRGHKADIAKLAQQLNVVPYQQSHFRRLITILADEGILRCGGPDWLAWTGVAVTESARIRRSIADKYPSYEVDLVTMDRCGSGLADVLRGALDPRQLVFPEGSVDQLFRGYSESPFLLVYNAFIRDCVGAVVHALPKNRTIRVLEIGSGTGGTTAHLLPVLPPDRTEYVFSDVSGVFLTAARARFANYPFVEFTLLDIDSDGENQGFFPHSFDLVIAADVLHATQDLRKTLKNVQRLLASDGLLIALEIARNWRLFDIVYGSFRDWWHFGDADPRGSQFWLPEPAWASLLADCGFVETAAVSDSGTTWQGVQNLLLARGPHLEAETNVRPSPMAETPATWIIFADEGGVGGRIAAEIEDRGDSVVFISVGECFAQLAHWHFQVRPDSLEDLTTLLQTIDRERPNCRGVLHLWCLDAEHRSSDEALHHVQELGCVNILRLVQALDRCEIPTPIRLWLITRGAQQVGAQTKPPHAAQALLWGLGRVVMNEHPHLRTTMIDLDPDPALEEWSHLVDELYAEGVEQEIAWRGGARYALRLVRSQVAASGPATEQAQPTRRHRPFHLEAATPGALESLRLVEVQRRRPGRREIEVETCAAGLNFRDVMKAMGLHLDHLGDASGFGDECAGSIVRVGEGVSEFAVGDEVIGVGPGCFGSFVTMPSNYVVRKPREWTFEQAATIPIAFLTAHYALNHVARIRKGERLLIHSAAGGVGLAAVQLAQRAGAEIFATAGNPEKHTFLRSLGIENVMDSHSLGFAEEVMALTKGRGVDVVLNSLAGEFLVKSLGLLRPTGRFLELGKVDFFENSKLGLAPFRFGLSFVGVDLRWLLENEADFSKQLFSEVMEMFEHGALRPLPVRTFAISEASSAFRLIAQGRHIGKIALRMREQPGAIARRTAQTPLFREDATYLVTGGLRGFGLAMAEWMVKQGAQHLVLVGRTGASSPDTQAAVARLQDAGAVVVAAKADVRRENDVAALLVGIDRTMPPLRGVFHAAMVIDDGFLLQLDAERFRHVIAPKALGAWHLHRHTLGKKLDFFMLFSSMACVQGTPGQGNYAAANAFLDALAHHRRALNLPALAVNWAAISDVGYVARHTELERELQRQGVLGISSSQAGSILDTLLRSERCQVAVIPGDLEQFTVVGASEATTRRFSAVLQQSQRESARVPGTTQKALLRLLHGSAPEARPHVVEAALRVELARVLGVHESQIDPEEALADLGVDSLMSVELEVVVRNALGIDLPLGFLVSDNVTLRHLSRRLADQSQNAIDQLTSSARSSSEQPPVPVYSVAAPAGNSN